MATMNVGGGGGSGRRAVDSELALVPMIDLLVCCITFLLLTAAWSLMHRLPADAPLGNRDNPCDCDAPPQRLTVEMQEDGPFRLIWKQGNAVLSTTEVPRVPVVVERHGQQVTTYPGLRDAVEKDWRAKGRYGEADAHRDVAILKTPDRTSFGEMTAVMDAVYGVSRKGQYAGPAFALLLGN
jgi:biopolymer transport protein ExbD